MSTLHRQTPKWWWNPRVQEKSCQLSCNSWGCPVSGVWITWLVMNPARMHIVLFFWTAPYISILSLATSPNCSSPPIHNNIFAGQKSDLNQLPQPLTTLSPPIPIKIPRNIIRPWSWQHSYIQTGALPWMERMGAFSSMTLHRINWSPMIIIGADH